MRCSLLVAFTILFSLSTTVYSAPEKSRSFNLLYDKDLSANAGASLIIAGLRAYQFADDTYLSSTEGSRSLWMAGARASKLFLIEMPLSSLGMVLQHERFGHGARAREFGIPISSYEIKFFEGSTSFTLADYNQHHPTKKSVFTTGGMEATTVMANQVKQYWLESGQIDSREAIFYLLSYFDQTDYVLNTSSNSETSSGNDITNYINLTNTFHKREVLTTKKLKNAVLLDFFDPFLFYSMASLGNYIATGSQTMSYYTVHIEGYQYVPSVRTWLTPWGPEHQWQNYIKTPEGKVYQVNFRYGKTGGIQSSGLSVYSNRLFEWKNWIIDGKLDLWRQPHINTGPTIQSSGRKLGIGGYSKGRYAFSDEFETFLQLGFKTSGYLLGEPLSKAYIARIGMTFNL